MEQGEFPYTLSHSTFYTVSPIINILHSWGTFVTTDEIAIYYH